MEESREFKIHVESLELTYIQFVLDQTLHKKVADGLYTKFRPVWDILLLSTECAYIVGLEKILEKKEFEKIISNDQGPKGIRAKVKDLRDNFFAHLNTREMRNPKIFFEKNALGVDERWNLFNKIIGFVHQYNEKLGYTEDIKQIFDRLKEDTQIKCTEWVDFMNSRIKDQAGMRSHEKEQ